jgi:hypothetical protein
MSSVTNLFGGGGGGGSAPAAPNYQQLAEQTAANNLKAAQTATAANRVNQNTPYGSLNYAQSGVDQYGNPMWSANQSVNPLLQPAVSSSLQNVSSQYATPFTGGDLPSYGINPGQTYSDAIMSRLAPTMQHQSEMSDQALANQGIMPGSQAYNNAKRLLQQSQNDQLTSAIVGGMNTGLQANQQQYGQNLTTYNNLLNNAMNIKSLATPSYINPPTQQATTGADALAAGQAQYNAQLGLYNAQQAGNQNQLSGLFGLGSAALMSPKGTFSGLSNLSSLFGGGSSTPNWSNPYAGYDNGGGSGLSGIE